MFPREEVEKVKAASLCRHLITEEEPQSGARWSLRPLSVGSEWSFFFFPLESARPETRRGVFEVEPHTKEY